MVTEFTLSIFVADLSRSKSFYMALLDLAVAFESDWCIQLASNANQAGKLTLLQRDHALVPAKFRKDPQGVSATFVVPDTDAVFAKAKTMGLQIVQEPRNEFYGQRRFLTLDPDGMLVDVSSLCELSPEFQRQVQDASSRSGSR